MIDVMEPISEHVLVEKDQIHAFFLYVPHASSSIGYTFSQIDRAVDTGLQLFL